MQVCRGTRALAQRRLLSLSSSSAHELAPCPVTCFPYVWGMQERYASRSPKLSIWVSVQIGMPSLCASLHLQGMCCLAHRVLWSVQLL